ncbi:hypothetical protein E8E14_010912 [Neopestalotiopsis sp. 37M]|nr:hypothetical protein E8E14_010912 [Neopestalotiopsis sp. 37M]
MISAAQWLTSLSVIAFGALECHGSAIHHHAPFSNTSSSCDISSTGSTYTQTTETSSTKYITSSEDMTTSTSVFTTSSTKPSGSDCSNSTLVYPTTKTTSYSTITSVVVTTSRSTRTTTTSITPTTITTTTIPSTITSIVTYPVTTHTTQTVIDECPTTCSIYAGTVNLFFWPTDNDYIYPSTYVDASLDYTLEASTSPSVYMLVDVIYGTNSLGIVGPSATSKIFPLDLDEVSTIVGGTVTEQLSLSDLGTDCPQSEPPSVIATLSDSRCDPILAAPDEVKSWAWPCNACGRFGLFDPPYAIPTLTGGLIGPTTTTTATVATSAATGATPTAVTTTQVIVTSAATATTSAAGATDTTSEVISLGPSGIVIIAYYSGTSFTTTIPTAASTVVYDGQTLTLGGDAATLPTIDASLTASIASTTSAAATSGSGPSSSTDNDPTTTSTPSAIATAEAPRAMVRSAWLFMSVFILACVLL